MSTHGILSELRKLSEVTNASRYIFLMVVLLFRNTETPKRKSEILNTVITWAEHMSEEKVLEKMQELAEYPSKEQIYQMESEAKMRFR